MDELTEGFDVVASYFSMLSETTRLRIMHAICDEEKTVSQIVEELGATQTNVSRHLSLMYRGGMVARRKAGNQVYYRIADEEMVNICREVCNHIADKIGKDKPIRSKLLRLMPTPKPKPKKRAS